MPKSPKSVCKSQTNTATAKRADLNQQINALRMATCVAPKLLRYHTDPANLPASTREADAPDIGFGQARAVQALTTALDIHASGYHVFAAGENGLGKRTLVMRLLQDYAKRQPTPDDWVYVHNFSDARAPIALALPASMGQMLADDIKACWLALKRQLNQRFRSDHYQSKVEAIRNQISLQEQQAYDALNEEGKQYALALAVRASDNRPIFVSADSEASDSAIVTTTRHLTTNKRTDKVDKHTDSSDVTPASSKSISPYVANFQDKNHMQKRLNLLTITLEQIEDEANQTLQALHQSLARRTLTPLLTPLLDKYQNLPNVVAYLRAFADDIVAHVEPIINENDDEFLPSHFSPLPARYFVNVITSHVPDAGAPVVFEDLPTHLNLLGHVEQITHLGTVSTDVSLIRAGSLHRANGGYLILEASSLLEYPYAWQGLKRALQSRQLKMSSLEQMLTLTGSISLEPHAIALDVKVILLGEPDLYYDLLEFEPEFHSVFKIRADFHDRIARTPANERAMVAKIADMVDKYGLHDFDYTALAALLDYLSEQAEDQQELTLHSDRLAQLLLEANQKANQHHADQVGAAHIEAAIADMRYRAGYLRQLFWQELQKGQQLISTQGTAVGQINALTVVSYADSEFGLPARMTANVYHSHSGADILDIERDVELGGAIHAKSVLIMSNYLRGLFADDFALNFAASLAFEQSYGGIDGDSATVAGVCALLSALAQVPICQNLAVTGSMNQFGQVQAVGGVNAKIAGFYDACLEQNAKRGTGAEPDPSLQGVIIPKANLSQLMLRQDIVEAVAAGRFVIYAVEHVNEALALLTGFAVASKTKKGIYRKHTLYGRIHARLAAWEQKDNEKNA